MANKIKYFKDSFSGFHYLLIAFMVFFGLVIIMSIYRNYSEDPNKIIYWLLPIIYLVMSYIFISSYYKKIAVDEKGNITLPGNVARIFIPHTNVYWSTYVGINFQFNRSNIKKIAVVPYKDRKNAIMFEKAYLTKAKEIVLIEFKKPLLYAGWYKPKVPLSNVITIDKIYTSVYHPREFVRYITNLSK